MKIAIITAGGAGMFCGSCMQDNTLARALRQNGADALLIPTYTPIRVDEQNVSDARVFLGGINVYLDSLIPGWKYLPRFLTSWLNRPAVIRLLTRFSSSTDASQLGGLTVDMLRGSTGPQQREIAELVDYLCNELRPDVVLFSNALLSGMIPALRQRFAGPLVTLLQGDDIFLEGLTPQYRRTAIDLVSRNCAQLDAVLTHSRYYAEFMQNYLALSPEKFRQIPLALDTELPAGIAEHSDDAALTIGYFARICPEKGVHRLLDAAARVLPQLPTTRLVIAGFLPEQHRNRFLRHLQQVQQTVGDHRIHWAGSPPTRVEKFQLLQSFDVLCVPTEYREPKGLYVLEAALCGVSSLLPAHGAFPERIAELGSGRLYDPQQPGSLEAALQETCRELLQSGRSTDSGRAALRQRLLDVHSMSAAGRQLLQTLQSIREHQPA